MKIAPVGCLAKAAFAGAAWMVMGLLAGSVAYVKAPDQGVSGVRSYHQCGSGRHNKLESPEIPARHP